MSKMLHIGQESWELRSDHGFSIMNSTGNFGQKPSVRLSIESLNGTWFREIQKRKL